MNDQATRKAIKTYRRCTRTLPSSRLNKILRRGAQPLYACACACGFSSWGFHPRAVMARPRGPRAKLLSTERAHPRRSVVLLLLYRCFTTAAAFTTAFRLRIRSAEDKLFNCPMPSRPRRAPTCPADTLLPARA